MHVQVLENPHIGSQSYLSTDYLNVFTEIVILLEEVADHPEYIEEIREWAPTSYCDHFRDSHLPFNTLAIWAYENAPEEILDEFKSQTGTAVDLIEQCVDAIEKAHTADTLDKLRPLLANRVHRIRSALEKAGDLIDKNEHHVHQDDIDALFA